MSIKAPKLAVMAIVVAFVSLNFVAVATGTTTTTPSGQVTIGTAVSTTITDLNPFTATNSIAADLVQEMYADNLLYMWPNGNLTSWLAENYTVTDHSNGTETILFHLNPNAQWVNGSKTAGQITSKDVQFTFQILMNNNTLNQAEGGVADNLTSVTTPNNTTVVFNFNKTSTLWLTYVSQLTILPSAWAKYDSGNPGNIGSFTNMFAKIGQEISAGPFYLNSSSSQGATLKANTNFWMGVPKTQTLYLEEFKSTTASTEALKTGAIGAEIPATSDYNSLSTTPNITNVVFPAPYIVNLWFNDNAAPFNNVHIRMGMAYAINKTQIMVKAEDNQGVAGSQNVSYGGLPTVLKQWWASGLTYYPYNTALAKQELEMAGYHYNSTTGLMVNNTTNANINVTIVDPSISDWEAAATLIATDLQAVGINAVLEVTPISTWANDVFTASNFVNGICTYYGYVPSLTNPSYDLQELYGYNGGWNAENYTNKTVDTLLNQSLSITNQTQLKTTLDKVQKIIDEQVPVVQIENAYNYYAYNNNEVRGFLSNISIFNPYNLMQVYPVVSSNNNGSAGLSALDYGIIGAVVVVVIGGIAGYAISKNKKKKND